MTVVLIGAGRLPNTIFRYVFVVSWPHQIALVILTVVTFLLEIVPLELQRRIVNNLVKERPFQLIVTLCAAYAGAVMIQGAIKLGLNVYRGWVAENSIRDLRRRVLAYSRAARSLAPGAEACGVGAAMIVAEVEPIGGWLVHTDQLEVGGVVAFISAVGRLNDPWGDLVNYFRDFSVSQVKFQLLADIVNQLIERRSTVPIGPGEYPPATALRSR